jgi:hypothetical protein
VTDTPTATPTPFHQFRLYPNPLEGGGYPSFRYRLDSPADEVRLRIYSVAFRKVFEDAGLPTAPGVHLHVLDWGSAARDLSNGLYYVVVTVRSGDGEDRRIMKMVVRR